MKERRVDFDVTGRYRESNFVELMGKNYRIKVIRPYSANITAFLKFLLSKTIFSWSFEKRIFFAF